VRQNHRDDAFGGIRNSWWLVDAISPDELHADPLDGRQTADVCIVGGGFTGLWTALRIKELSPDTDVVVVEANVCGGGASGRNGGFALTFWHHYTTLERICGPDEALRLSVASEDAVAEIGRFCDAHGIEARYRHAGWLWTATNAAQQGAWRSTVEAIERRGLRPFRSLSQEEVAHRTGSAQHLGGVFEETAASVQPARLARGLRRVALEQGVRIYERSPMIELGRDVRPEVRTARGAVAADRVVLAMNAWSAQLREVRNALVVVASDIVLTDPIPDVIFPSGWTEGVCISDSRLMVNYYHPTPDRRLAFGKGGGGLAYGGRIGSAFNGGSQRMNWVAADMRRLYPTLSGVPIADHWVGPIDRSMDGLPFFMALGRPDLICGAGFSGNGVGPSVLGGRILASMALGLDDEWVRCGLVRSPAGGLPPEPLRYLGGRLVRSAVARKERAEDGGDVPAPLDRRLVRLAPPGLVPLD
jgi:putative aminophosphonate oxidoreductase